MEAIGERLRHRREELGITPEQAAEATKFPLEIITAVEEGRVGVFSAKVYHIAFIRAYARFLKLDADELVRNQKSEEERAQEALRGIRAVPERSRSPRRMLALIAGVAILAMIILVVTNRVFQPRRGEAGKPAESAEASRETQTSQRQPKGAPKMVRVEAPQESVGHGEVAPVAPARQAGAQAQRPDSASADTTKAVGPMTVPGTNWPIIPASQKQRVEPGVRTLEISAHGGTSLKLTDGDSTMFDGMLTGGDKKVFTTHKRFFLAVLSDRNAVSLTLDGKPVALPQSDKRGLFDYALP
ncbi:MAG TPA: helix-turn-helix domain-containing protein [bacterium]|nr:helix-turn-helix domain-containing protein [bacterium]